jgi:peptidoglycan biosynthesis protein MviN/MurJ (putative lipid II flippase)
MEADSKLGLNGILNRFAAIGPRREGTYASLIKQGLGLGGLAVGNSALAFLMIWYVVTSIGVNVETDAFFASGALPQFVFIVLSATLLPVLVPLLTTRDAEHFSADAWSFFTLTAALFTLIAVVLYAASAVWVPLLVPGFSATGKLLTISLTRIQLISMVLNAVIVALWAAQHARGRFVWVEFSGLIANLAGLLFLAFALPRFGIRAAAWNAVFYNSLKLLFLLPVVGRGHWPAWRSPTVREAARRFKPLLPGHLYLRADPMLDRFLTSMTGVGNLSLLYIAQQVYANIILVLGKAVVAPMTPKLAVEARAGAWTDYRRTYHSRLLLTLIVASLGCLLLAVGTPALRLVIGHGGVTAGNVNMLWLIMVALAGAFVGGILSQVTAGAYYAMGNTKTPTKVSAFIYTFFILIKVAAFFKYGVLGLAITISAYSITNFLVQFLILGKAVAQQAPQLVHAVTEEH